MLLLDPIFARVYFRIQGNDRYYRSTLRKIRCLPKPKKAEGFLTVDELDLVLEYIPRVCLMHCAYDS